MRQGAAGTWLAYAAAVVAAVYALVSFYWAFGGTAGVAPSAGGWRRWPGAGTRRCCGWPGLRGC
jgi:hypothetical protein